MFVFASQTETFGNVTLEAMASGLAVVAFKHAGAGELIQNGVNGMLADYDSNFQFEMAAQALLNTPDLMKFVRQQASLSAKSMGWEVIVAKTESVLHDICEKQEPVVTVNSSFSNPIHLLSQESQ
jgi:glycosyltransferase involved in cell wall biosynthesis